MREVKSGLDGYGRAVGLPTEDILVRNVTVASGTLGGFALGSEMSGGLRNITVVHIGCVGGACLGMASWLPRGVFLPSTAWICECVAAVASPSHCARPFMINNTATETAHVCDKLLAPPQALPSQC